jgi:phospholipase/lecithinase/hemolysin
VKQPWIFGILLAASLASASAQTRPPFIGMGDSLGEGVQSGNASWYTQPTSYLARFAHQMNVPFQLPLLRTSPIAFIGVPNGRSRLNAAAVPDNLAVSGAKLDDILHATAATTPTTETDFVLAPFYGLSQIEIVEQRRPAFVICWGGTDDLIREVLSFDHLDTATGTPLPLFTTEYTELLSRLKATGANVVVGNIPDLTKIAFLFDNDDLTRYTGIDYHLPAGSYTTLATMILLKLGVYDASVLQSPAYVLSPSRITALQQQIQQYNAVIESVAASYQFPVVDAYALLDSFAAQPVTIAGVTLTNHFNGGYFSLDGVHPSNFASAILANVFISAANSAYSMNIPPISNVSVLATLLADPFVDLNGDGVVRGRPYTGLLETLGPSLGISGNLGKSQAAGKAEFMRLYREAKGLDPSGAWTNADVIRAVAYALGSKSRLTPASGT